MGTRSSDLVQMGSICSMLEAAPTLTSSLYNSSKEGSNNVISSDQSSESSSIQLASPLRDPPISNPVHWAKGKGEESKHKTPSVVSLSVLGKDGMTIGKDVKGGSITSYRLVEGESTIKSSSKGREDA